MLGANGMYIMGFSEIITSKGRRNGVLGGHGTGSDGFSLWSEIAHDHEPDGKQAADGSDTMEVCGKQTFRQSAPRLGTLPFITLFLILISFSPSTLAILTAQQSELLHDAPALSSRAPNQSVPLLECLQVSPPILSPNKCQQTLMVHT